ncbi:MAG: hypothetical protein KIT14_05480 [bacterium]|nr:hypothetical protein [bacterium]
MRRTTWMVAVLGLFLPAVARAIDVSGPWHVGIGFTSNSPLFACRMTFTTAGSSLFVEGDCVLSAGTLAGSVDSVSGAFVVEGGEGFCRPAQLAGVVAPDGASFTGTMSCSSSTFTLFVTGSRCGNGRLDPGEGCDDGNRDAGDCCSSSCRPDPAGSTCDDGNVCMHGVCDGAGSCERTEVSGPCDDFEACTTDDTCIAGVCIGTTAPNGTRCNDFDACTGDGTCFGGFCYEGEPIDCGPCRSCDFFQGCVDRASFACEPIPAASQLRVADAVRDRDDALRLRFVPATSVDISDLGDPRRATEWEVCVHDGFGFGRLLASVRVPAGGRCNGRPCWRGLRRGYRYGDRVGRQDGVRSMTLQAGTAGQARVELRARGEGLDPGPLPAALGVLAQIRSSDGTCWETSWFDALRNGPLELRLAQDDR